MDKVISIDRVVDARISLNETEYLALVIGHFIELDKYCQRENLNEEKYIDLESFLKVEILRARAMSMQALEKKTHIPIKNALGLFFHFDKDKAMVMFQSVIRKDFNDTLDRMKNMEHLVYMERFFDRLKISYIPKLTGNPNDLLIIKNANDFIQREFLRNELDEYGMFSFSDTSFVNRNSPKPIRVAYLFESKFIKIMKAFFKIFNIECDVENLLILHNFLTSPHCYYRLYEINNARDYLFDLVEKNEIKQEYNYLLCHEIPIVIGRNIKSNFIEGISSFFSTKNGYSINNLKKYGRGDYTFHEFNYLQNEDLKKAMNTLIN